MPARTSTPVTEDEEALPTVISRYGCFCKIERISSSCLRIIIPEKLNLSLFSASLRLCVRISQKQQVIAIIFIPTIMYERAIAHSD